MVGALNGKNRFSVLVLNIYSCAEAEGRLWSTIRKEMQVVFYDFLNERVITIHNTLTQGN